MNWILVCRQKILWASTTKIKWLILYREIIVLYYKNHTKHISTMWTKCRVHNIHYVNLTQYSCCDWMTEWHTQVTIVTSQVSMVTGFPWVGYTGLPCLRYSLDLGWRRNRGFQRFHGYQVAMVKTDLRLWVTQNQGLELGSGFSVYGRE